MLKGTFIVREVSAPSLPRVRAVPAGPSMVVKLFFVMERTGDSFSPTLHSFPPCAEWVTTTLVQRKTTGMSECMSHLLVSLESGKLHPKALRQWCQVWDSEAVSEPKAGAQVCAPQPSGKRLGTLLHRSQGDRGCIGCKYWSQSTYSHV